MTSALALTDRRNDVATMSSKMLTTRRTQQPMMTIQWWSQSARDCPVEPTQMNKEAACTRLLIFAPFGPSI